MEALNIQKKSIVQEVAQIKEADILSLTKYLVNSNWLLVIILKALVTSKYQIWMNLGNFSSCSWTMNWSKTKNMKAFDIQFI